MAYDVLASNVRRLSADTTTGLPGGVVTLQLPDSDVPTTGLVLLVKGVDVMCPQVWPAAPCNLYDIDPTQGGSPAPCATTRFGNSDQGESPSGGIVIQSGGNLWIQWSNVLPGVICAARVQFDLAQLTSSGASSTPASHPVLGN